MWDIMMHLGLGLIAAGLLCGPILAFRRSVLTGVVTLLVGLTWIPIFLLFVRPEGFRKPLALPAAGTILAVLASTLG